MSGTRLRIVLVAMGIVGVAMMAACGDDAPASTPTVTGTSQTSTQATAPTNTPAATSAPSTPTSAPATNTPVAPAAATSTPTATAAPSTPTQAPAPTEEGVKSVSIVNYSFSPGGLSITAGTKVRWTNLDDDAHTATHASWDTGSLSKGASAVITFDQTGRFDYICALHPNMAGVVLVQ